MVLATLTDDEVAELVAHYDQHDPRLAIDPYRVHTALRERHPIARSDRHGGYWVVSDYEHAHFVLTNEALFSSRMVEIPPRWTRVRPLIPAELDGAEHRKSRALLTPAFSPGRMAGWEKSTREVCDELIDAFIERGHCDFVTELASPLPARIFTEIMGVPFEDAAQYIAWIDTVLHSFATDPTGAAAQEAGLQAVEYLIGLLAERRNNPADDMISALIGAEVDGERLSDEDILDLMFVLFGAGLDTTAASMSLHFWYLAEHPEQRDRIAAEPSLIPSAIEELLRWGGTQSSPGRVCTTDTELGGVQIKEGDMVCVNLAAANRDPKQFPDADLVILDRDPNRHLSFAVGPHRCIGAHLARMQMRVVYELMHSRIPSYRLAEGALIERTVGNTTGVRHLPLVWG